MVLAGILMTIVMALHGLGVIITKKLVNVNSIQINYIQGILILTASSVFMPFVENNTSYTDTDMWLILKSILFSGIPMAVGQLCYIAGLVLTKNLGMITTDSCIHFDYYGVSSEHF